MKVWVIYKLETNEKLNKIKRILYARRAAKFTNFTIVMKGKGRQTVSSCLSSMSCSALEYCLRNIAQELLDKWLPDDVDLIKYPSVNTGLKAVLNVMSDTNTWIYARDKADELNYVEHDEKQQ